ncbi:MAG: T9SS type A sorting domain-containing protein [Bacteroidota bacterium]
MKQFNSLLFAALLCVFGLSGLHAQVCTPDASVGDVPGLYPDTLVNGQIGTAYNQVISVVIPKDTALSVGGFDISLDICSFKLDSIPNLPAGMSFECDQEDCLFVIDHSDTSTLRGCVLLNGTPEQVVGPDDSLQVYVSVVAGSVDTTTFECTPLDIPGLEDFTTILFKTQLKIIDPNATSIDEAFEKELNISLYPNPASGSSTLSYQLENSVNIKVELLDLMGRVNQTVFEGRQAAGSVTQDIQLAGLSTGWYMVRITRNDQAQFSKSLWVQN